MMGVDAKIKHFSKSVNRVIEMAWEDRTPFDAIEATYGLNQNQVEDLMRDNLKKTSYVVWRKRAQGRKTKHVGLREFGKVGRHHSYDQHKHRKHVYFCVFNLCFHFIKFRSKFHFQICVIFALFPEHH